MNKRILGGLAVAAMLAGGLATTGGVAQAIVQDEGPAACYEQVPYTVYQFSKTTTTPAVEEVSHLEYRWDVETRTENTEFRYAKYTSIRNYVEATDGIWQNFSPNEDQGPFVGPPSHPTDPDGTWSKVKKLPPGQAGPDGVYSTSDENGRSSWFYRKAGTEGYWGPWSEWTAWGTYKNGGGYINGWGAPAGEILEGPAPHGSGKGWERIYRYQKVDERTEYGAWTSAGSTEWGLSDTPPAATVTTRYVNKQTSDPIIDVEYVPAFDTTVFYNDGSVGPTDLAVDGQRNPGWTTDQTLDRSWKQIRTDEFMKDGDQIPCSEQPKDDFDLRTDNGTCEPGDDFVTVTQYRTDFTYALDANFEWVRTQNGDEFIVTQDERELSEGEQEDCVPPADDPSVTREDVGEPVCDTTTIKVTVTMITYTPEYIEGAWVQVASEPVVTEEVRNLTAGEQSACPTTPTDVVEQLPPPPAAPAAPAAPVVPEIVAAYSPAQAPTTSAPAVSPDVSAGSLPATGSNGTGMTALLALLATSLGGVALLVARRRNVTT